MTYIGEGETFSHVSPKLSCDFQYSRILLANIASDREACDNERNVYRIGLDLECMENIPIEVGALFPSMKLKLMNGLQGKI